MVTNMMATSATDTIYFYMRFVLGKSGTKRVALV